MLREPFKEHHRWNKRRRKKASLTREELSRVKLEKCIGVPPDLDHNRAVVIEWTERSTAPLSLSLLVRFSCRPTESIAESIESLFVLSKILAVSNLSGVLRLLSFPRKRNSIVYFRWNIEFEPWNQGCRIGNVINEGHSRANVRKVNFFLSLSLSWNREYTVYRN